MSYDSVLVAKRLTGEYRVLKSGTKYEYIEIDYDAPQGWGLAVDSFRSGGGYGQAPRVSINTGTGKITIGFRREKPPKGGGTP